ncbi:ATP-binding cassette domain-containing protein [Microbacterium sp. Mu-80]|uniref:ATP-binding cassette domain-containing protein n=1 Tax=Microbacterium bandirmense TaxID=3122050 RepID=A0ABU8LAT7_9MICO
MVEPTFELKGARRTLPGGTSILQGIDLAVHPGESIAVVGRSGSGKSTLLAGLGLLSSFDHGSHFRLVGKDVQRMRERQSARLRARSIGFVLQNSGLIDHLSAMENVRMPLLHSRLVSPQRAKALAADALARMGIAHLARRRPAKVSGGERQRIAIARALAINPRLILADEPTGALDEHTGQVVLAEMLSRVREAAASLVVVTHDHEVAGQMDRVFRLEHGTLRQLQGLTR